MTFQLISGSTACSPHLHACSSTKASACLLLSNQIMLVTNDIPEVVAYTPWLTACLRSCARGENVQLNCTHGLWSPSGAGEARKELWLASHLHCLSCIKEGNNRDNDEAVICWTNLRYAACSHTVEKATAQPIQCLLSVHPGRRKDHSGAHHLLNIANEGPQFAGAAAGRVCVPQRPGGARQICAHIPTRARQLCDDAPQLLGLLRGPAEQQAGGWLLASLLCISFHQPWAVSNHQYPDTLSYTFHTHTSTKVLLHTLMQSNQCSRRQAKPTSAGEYTSPTTHLRQQGIEAAQ